MIYLLLYKSISLPIKKKYLSVCLGRSEVNRGEWSEPAGRHTQRSCQYSQVRLCRLRSEQTRSEQARSEQARSEQARSEQAGLEQARSELAGSE